MVADGVFDPTLGWILRLFLASVFVRAVYAKLRFPSLFTDAVRGYELVPARLTGAFAAALLAIECLIAPALLIPRIAPLAAWVAGFVLALYSLAIGINLARGRRDIDCGCAGPLARQTLHEMLIVRNLVYMVLAMVLAVGASVPPSARTLNWLDGFTIGFGVVSLFALALAIDGLAALAARSKTIGARP
jgi:uncharacterized membrane protein YphA (DoxX/SURF4 family)